MSQLIAAMLPPSGWGPHGASTSGFSNPLESALPGHSTNFGPGSQFILTVGRYKGVRPICAAAMTISALRNMVLRGQTQITDSAAGGSTVLARMGAIALMPKLAKAVL
jgi:hypothetical protein